MRYSILCQKCSSELPSHSNLCSCGEIFTVESLNPLLEQQIIQKYQEKFQECDEKKEGFSALVGEGQAIREEIYGNFTHLHFPHGAKTIPQLWYFSNVSHLDIPDTVESLEVQKYSNFNCFYNAPTHALEHTSWLDEQKDTFVIVGDGLCVAVKGLDKNADVLEIPSQVKHISAGVFRGFSMKSVVFPSDLQSIGTQAFQNCYELEAITLPEGLLHLGDLAFDGCEKLGNSLRVPSKLRYLGAKNPLNKEILQEIMQTEEEECLAGDGILIGHKGKGAVALSEKVKFIYQIKSEQITALTISSTVSAIRESVGEKSLDLPNLTELTFGNGIAELPVDSFSGFKGLKIVNLPQTLKKIRDNAFYNCPSLEKICLPNSLECLGSYAFSGCTSLEEIDIPSTLRSLGEGAFFQCRNLKTAIINSGIFILPPALFQETALKKLELPESLLAIQESALEGCDVKNTIPAYELYLSFQKRMEKYAYLVETWEEWSDTGYNETPVSEEDWAVFFTKCL